MRSELLKKVAVRVSTSNSNSTTIGSGILIKNQSNDCFVITAGHCIHGKKGELLENVSLDNISVKYKYNNEDSFTEIKVLEIVYLDSENAENEDYHDIAILEVENFGKQADNVKCASFYGDLDKSTLKFRGFPQWINEELNESKPFECVIDDDDNTKFIVKSEDIKDLSLMRSINETSNGISGSGVFLEKEGILFLLGIITDLRDDKGTFGHLLCRKIGSIVEKFNFEPMYLPCGLNNLYKWQKIDKELITDKVNNFQELNNNHFINLKRKCGVLYDVNDVDEMVVELLECFFEAEINLEKLYKVNPILEQNIVNAQIDLKRRVRRIYNRRRVSDKEAAQNIYKEVIDFYVNLVVSDSGNDISNSILDRSSDRAVTQLLINCDLDFIEETV
ncbi:MAG: trypsin-like serine protease [Marinisporobacter sp.]|jgi:hypothetical protein|nr:trypsin-like serine protease [Marinisporobacter sp.]